MYYILLLTIYTPGPPRRSLAAKAPTTEEKVDSLSTSLSQFEAKVAGLEQELDAQKKDSQERVKGSDWIVFDELL